MDDLSRKWTDLAERDIFIPDTIYGVLPNDEPLHRQDDPDRWQQVIA